MHYLPGSVQWMLDVASLPVSYPLKNYQHHATYIWFVKVHFVMQFVFRMWFPAIYIKVRENEK